MLSSTSTSVTSKIGLACSTAVALGVKPKNLKALGPEKACPIFAAWFALLREGPQEPRVFLGTVVGAPYHEEGVEDRAWELYGGGEVSMCVRR